MHVYRDRRHRILWGRSRASLIRAGVTLLLVLLALLLTVLLIARLRQGGGPSRPAATVAPTAIPTVEPTPAPTPTPVPTPTPSVLDLTPTVVERPSFNIDSREALIDLYWWLIYSGESTVQLEALSLPESELIEVTDKFSNYFDAFTYTLDPPSMHFVLKPGVKVLTALQRGDWDSLNSEEQLIADMAQEIVTETLHYGMSDLEKELALHDYIAEHCEYLLQDEFIHTEDARGFFQYGRCQCAGYVDTFRLLGRLAGLEIEMIGGPTTRDLAGTKGHAWNLIRLDGRWYVADLTWDDMIAGTGAVEHTFFNLPPASFGNTRSWDQTCCPDGAYATALDEKYYYYRQEYVVTSKETALASAIRQLDAGGTAYICFREGDYIQEVAAELQNHYPSGGTCTELSRDLNFSLYKFTLR